MTNRIPRLAPFGSFLPTTRQMLSYLLLLTAWSCSLPLPTITLGDWKIRAELEGPARTAATGFTIGKNAFIGTGSNRNILLNDFWLYDQTRNTWAQAANFPGVSRSGGVGFAVGYNGYIGLGVDAQGNRLKDFYEYSYTTNKWRRIADFGGTARLNAVAFTVGVKGYVGFGDDLNNAKDLWAYNSFTDEWQKMATYTGSARVGAVALVIGDLGYVGTGSNQAGNLSDWWAYDPAKDLWIKKHDFPTDQSALIQGSGGVGFTINGKGYLCQSNTTNNVILEYDPMADSWTTRGKFEGANRQNSFGFSLGTKGYITTGRNSSGSTFGDLWEFDPTIAQVSP